MTCSANGAAALCSERGVDPSATACSVGLGICKTTGLLSCAGTCNLQAGTPDARGELCGNAADDDCDGVVDLDFAHIDKLGDACDSTATDANGGDSDLCAGGIFVCHPSDLTRVTCDDDNTTIAEACDGLDNDCDGATDEDFSFGTDHLAIGAACDGADSDRCLGGKVVCLGGEAACKDDAGNKDEACNGIDDDCDGEIDQTWTAAGGGAGPYLGAPCDGSNDEDRCANGRIECNLDFSGVYCHETAVGIAEVCNRADDDCDGTTDEGFGVGESCVVGIGRCENTGLIACIVDSNGDDNETAACNVAPLPGRSEQCNSEDDDCDGFLNEGGVCGALETDIRTGPPFLTASSVAAFTYVNPRSVPERAHTSFECSLDGGAYTLCNLGVTTPDKTYVNLAQGPHTLLVRATNPDGSFDPTPDYWTWVVDVTTPDTLILSAPTNPSQNPDGTFVFGTTTPNPGPYSCLLDPEGGTCPPPDEAMGSPAGLLPAYAICPEVYSYTNLADGPHRICVYVTDTRGVVDPLPATWTWVIDTTAPETAIVPVLPPEDTSSTSVVFHYVDPTATSTNTFECSLDGGEWLDCNGKTETYRSLAEGEHLFEVRTVDPSGNVDPTPASFTWVVDLTAPCATISVHPTDPSQNPTAFFGFTASEPDVRYFCALDPTQAQLGRDGEPLQSAYTACDAATTFGGLEDGEHTLWVYVVDQVGNLASCRASYTWVLDTTYPATEITSGPTSLTGTGEPIVFEYVDPTNEDALTFECRLDGGEWTRCDGIVEGEGGYSELDDVPVGRHDFEVRACDFTKAPPVQCDPNPATWMWEVTQSSCPNDHTSPTLECAAELVLECASGGAAVEIGTLAPQSSDTCPPVGVASTATESVGIGETPVVFVAIDGNGNTSSCLTLVRVVDTTAASITCPPDVLAATTDAGLCSTAVDVAGASGNDACQGTSGLLFVNDAPALFGPGETQVTHHVLDAFGNQATCVQNVVVVDDEPLVLTCSASATVDAEPDQCGWTGVREALARDNCSGPLKVDVEGTYPVGESPVVFTAEDAAGNGDECTTLLTVRDVTNPVVLCGEAVGGMPAVIRASASDACDAVVTLENVACARVVDGARTAMELEDCAISVNGDTIEISARLTEGTLEVSYDARAVDPSGNAAVVSCTQSYDPDRDADGTVDAEDNCVGTPNGDQGDSDGDGVGDLCDLCPEAADAAQADRDDDGIGDACSDKDGDTVLDIEDNCELIANTDQSDVDIDGEGDKCDPSPYEGLTAEGSGGCAGGAGGLLGGALMGLALVLARRRR